MDFLARADQANNDAPIRDALCKIDEMLRFRLPVATAIVPCGYLSCVEGPLRLIKDEHVLRGHEFAAR